MSAGRDTNQVIAELAKKPIADEPAQVPGTFWGFNSSRTCAVAYNVIQKTDPNQSVLDVYLNFYAKKIPSEQIIPVRSNGADGKPYSVGFKLKKDDPDMINKSEFQVTFKIDYNSAAWRARPRRRPRPDRDTVH